jgi:hypothetical protein
MNFSILDLLGRSITSTVSTMSRCSRRSRATTSPSEVASAPPMSW